MCVFTRFWLFAIFYLFEHSFEFRIKHNSPFHFLRKATTEEKNAIANIDERLKVAG